METKETKQTGNKEEKGKIARAFNKNLGMLVALLGGETLFKPAKGDKSDLEKAMEKLVAKEKEALIESIVTEATTMINEKREFDKFVKQQRQELEKKVEEKQKQFNEKSKKLFALVQDVQALEKSYAETLKNAVAGKENAPEEETADDNEESDK